MLFLVFGTPLGFRHAAWFSARRRTLEQTVRACHEAGLGQRAIARELSIDRRKVKRILDQAA